MGKVLYLKMQGVSAILHAFSGSGPLSDEVDRLPLLLNEWLPCRKGPNEPYLKRIGK